ncbi:MAG TPA: substrate-binding domain-containing protein [Actinoplanes sp.]|nr:substrate-binding domain-containing protein [Actinoplanes sp.]
MRKQLLALAATLLTSIGLAGCGDDQGPSSNARPKIGVILPDSATSNRWEHADRRYLQAAFEAADVDYDIQNAQGDKDAFLTLAERMITDKVSVLMIVNLDSVSGKTVLDKAAAAGVATIDYDRLTLGGGARYYVSFDNVMVGTLLGEGLVSCLSELKVDAPLIAQLNGAPTDNNATLLKQGYDAVLQPRFDSGAYVKGPDHAVPDWDNTQAGAIFAQDLAATKGRINGVVAANDGLANAAISVLRRHGLNGRVPVTGQDATIEALRNILAGDQCMTVYKAVKQLADAAADLAVGLAKGTAPPTEQSIRDTVSGRDVPAVLLTPKAIFKDNVKDVIADGYHSQEEVCKGVFAALCADAGIG